MTWIRNFKADIDKKDYAVFGRQLFDTEYYGEFGMDDRASSKPMNEWSLEICSWEKLRYNRVEAGAISRTQLVKTFKDKDEANKMWKILKDNELTYDELETIYGFTRTHG